jgi:hypothetical protein
MKGEKTRYDLPFLRSRGIIVVPMEISSRLIMTRRSPSGMQMMISLVSLTPWTRTLLLLDDLESLPLKTQPHPGL